jgi:hypothetical protein
VDEEYVEDETVDPNDLADAQQDYQEEALASLESNYPIQKEQQGLYQTLWKMIQRRDSTKIANLQKVELGDVDITVRGAQHLSKLGDIFGNPLYADFYKAHAEISLATSMSRDGWLGELFISQKKFSAKTKKASSPLTPQKWKLFGNNKKAEGQ